jgi:hypothetical protein
MEREVSAVADDENNIDKALSDPVLAELIGELRGMAEAPPPQIKPELESILGGFDQLARARDKRRNRLRSGGVGLAVAGVVAAGLGAAAANELPAPAQRAVARVVNGLTPFEIPHPEPETTNAPAEPANSVIRPQDSDEVRDTDSESSTIDNDDDPDGADSEGEEARDRGDANESSEDSEDGDDSGDGDDEGEESSDDSDDDGGDGESDEDDGESEDSESSTGDDDSESGDDEED